MNNIIKLVGLLRRDKLQTEIKNSEKPPTVTADTDQL